MKKILSLVTVALLLLGTIPLATAQTAAKKAYYIGYSLPTTEGYFMSSLAQSITQRLKDKGHRVEYTSADGSPSKQMEQIENFITKGVDELIVMALDATSLTDVLTKAQKKGIKVFAFSKETTPNDFFMGTDEFAVGKQIALMASEWIDKSFPTAKAGSVDVAIFEFRGNAEAARRSDGMKEIAKINPKARIVKTVGVDTTTKDAQSAAENLLLTNKTVKVILCFNSDTASGANAYAMALNSKVKDKGQFAVYGCDYNDEALAMIKKSLTNESVYRGTIRMGTSLDALFDDVVKHALLCLDPANTVKTNYASLYQITGFNWQEMTK